MHEREDVEDIQERKIYMGREEWRIMTVYNREGEEKVLKQIGEVVGEGREGNLLIDGDFNARVGIRGGGSIWDIQDGKERTSRDKIENRQEKLLVKFIEEKGWIILNWGKEGNEEGEWTCRGTRFLHYRF